MKPDMWRCTECGAQGECQNLPEPALVKEDGSCAYAGMNGHMDAWFLEFDRGWQLRPARRA